MARARGPARRQLVGRLLGRRNRRRGAGLALPRVRGVSPFVVLLLALGVVGWPIVRDAIRHHPYFAVRDVLVRDHRRLTADEIRATAGILPGMSTWDVDPRAAETRLRAHRWVRSARVRRELPHRVVIHVREERPLAIVAFDDGKRGEYYVAAHGRIVAPVDAAERRDFPYLTGLAETDLRDGDPATARALRRALALVRRSPGFEVSEVHVDRARGLTLLPVRPAIPIEVGWGGFETKLARLPRVLRLWAGREPEIASVSLLFDDQVIVRARGARPTERRARS